MGPLAAGGPASAAGSTNVSSAIVSSANVSTDASTNVRSVNVRTDANANGSSALSTDSGALLTWSKLGPSTTPPGRIHAALALDGATGTTVLFGGRSGSQLLADTWTWDGSTWTARTPAASPPALESASLAYDNIGHRILLFGGIGSDGNATDGTWAWDGATWTNLAPASAPPARYGASLVSDAVTGTDVLFGGLSASGSSLGDTWSWNGTAWAAEAPAASPPPRSAAAMTFDATRGVIVLFGGLGATANRADTWTWDGKNWTPLTPAASPPARNDAALGFDSATQTAVLFGGSSGGSVLGDTWLWNGSNWSTSLPLSLLPVLNPPARSGAAIAPGPGNHRLVLFGGQPVGPAATASPFDDTWNVATLVTGPPPTTVTTAPGSTGGSTTAPATASPSSTVPAKVPAASTPPVTPAAHPTPVPSPLKVTASSVHRGQQVTVSGSGFVPHATITISFHSAPVVVGTAVADAGGRFTATVSVPTDLADGPHHIEADGATPTGGRATLVAQVSIMAPGSHHGWLVPALMVTLTVLLAGGAGVVLTASTRWRPLARR